MKTLKEATQAIEQLFRKGYIEGGDHLARIRAELGILQANAKKIENASAAVMGAQIETHRLAEFISKELSLIWQAAQVATDTIQPYDAVLEGLRIANDARKIPKTKAPPAPPKHELGAVLRYGEGATVFFQVKQHALDLRSGGWVYVGQHVLRSVNQMVGPIKEEACTPITDEERYALRSMGTGQTVGVRDGVL